MQYLEHAKQLIALRDRDLRLRDRLLRDGELDGGYHPEMERVHGENATRLAEIIDAIGYPTAERVGEVAAEAAWLVVQHAIGRPQFMRRCRKLLAEEAGANPAAARQLAYLTDRIAYFGGEPQRYGTQFDWDADGKMSPCPCDDPAAVDRRRAALGWNTLAEQTEIMRRRATADERLPPGERNERQRRFAQWRRQVGWAATFAPCTSSSSRSSSACPPNGPTS